LPSAPSYSSSGQVAFYGEGTSGQSGIYRMRTGPPIKVADLNTAIPNGSGNFTAFHPATRHTPSFHPSTAQTSHSSAQAAAGSRASTSQ